MKYTIVDESRIHPSTINVRFCRDCDLFEENYYQPDPENYREGWCRRYSYYLTFEDEYPHYVYKNSNDFCNEDLIGDEDVY